MAANTSKGSLFATRANKVLGTKVKAANESSTGKRGLFGIPEGSYVFRVTSAKAGLTKKGKDPYVSITLVIVDPSDYSGRQGSILHVISPAHPNAPDYDEERKFTMLLSDLKLLLPQYENEVILIEDVEGLCEELTELKPLVEGVIVPSKNAKYEPKAYLRNLSERTEYADPDNSLDEEEEEAEEEEVDLDSLSRAELRAYIKVNDLDVRVTKSMSDSDIVDAILALDEEDEEEDEPEETEEVDAATEDESEDEEEEIEDEEDEEEEDEDDSPQKGYVYEYTARSNVKASPHQVVSVNNSKQTVQLKREKDNKVFKNVPWDSLGKLISDEVPF